MDVVTIFKEAPGTHPAVGSYHIAGEESLKYTIERDETDQLTIVTHYDVPEEFASKLVALGWQTGAEVTVVGN